MLIKTSYLTSHKLRKITFWGGNLFYVKKKKKGKFFKGKTQYFTCLKMQNDK